MRKRADQLDVELLAWRGALFSAIVFLLFLGSPLWDAASLFFGAGENGARVSLVVRGGATVLCILYIVAFSGEIKKPPVLLFVFLWGCCAAAFLYLVGVLNWVTSAQMAEFYVFTIKMCSVFLYFEFLRVAITTHQAFKFLARAIDIALFCYIVAILSSPFLGFEFLHSYSTSERFGFRGIISAPNEAAGVLIVATAWYCLRSRHFKGRRNWYSLLIPLSLMAALFLGTKAALLGALGIYGVFLISRIGWLPAGLVLSSILAIVANILWFLYFKFPIVTLAVDSTVRYYEWQMVNTAGGSILTLIFSGRDLKASEVIATAGTMFPWAPLTGGYPVSIMSFELDLMDLMFSLGFVGTVVYIARILSISYSNGDNFRFLHCGMIMIVLLMAGFAGHVLVSGLGSIYLAGLLFHMHWVSQPIFNEIDNRARRILGVNFARHVA